MKTLSCSDLGITNCNFIAHGDLEKEVIDKMVEHGISAHPDKMKAEDKDEMVSIMKLRIKDEM